MTLVALVALALAAPRASGDGDGSEMTLVLATGGVAHPTGYPFYVILGHLFVRALHAFGVGWPLAANLWSVVGAAVALGLLYSLARELASGGSGSGGSVTPTIGAVAALVPVVVIAMNPIFLNEALLAEVYSWHLAWVMAASLAFVHGLSTLSSGIARDVGPRTLRRCAGLWGLLVGFGMAHHLTALLVAAPLTLALGVALVRLRRLDRHVALRTGIGVSLPVVCGVGVIAWRAWHPGGTQWPLLAPTPDSVLEHVTGAAYSHFLGRFRPSVEHARLVASAGTPLLVAGGAALLADLFMRGLTIEGRLARGGLLGAALLITIGGLKYGVPDPAPYFLPALALAAAGMAPLLARAARAARGTRPALIAANVGLVSLLGLLGFAWLPTTVARREEIRAIEQTARRMWGAIPDGDAIVFWPDDRYYRLVEYQRLRGEKTGLYVTTPEMLANDRPRAEFFNRFGFDPLAGLELPRLDPGERDERAAIDRFLVALVRNVTDRSAEPVILVDPTVPIVRQLRRSADSR